MDETNIKNNFNDETNSKINQDEIINKNKDAIIMKGTRNCNRKIK